MPIIGVENVPAGEMDDYAIITTPADASSAWRHKEGNAPL